MTRLAGLAGALSLAWFCVAWPPAVLLIMGVVLLSVARIRVANERQRGGKR